MKILLLRPPFAVEKFYFPRFAGEPLSLECLSSFVSPRHQVLMIDAVAEGWNYYFEKKEYPNNIFQGLEPKKIVKKIKAFQPDVIGITWLFSTQSYSVDLAIKAIREFDKNIPIIVGGPEPSADPIGTLKKNPLIDLVVYGEGEITLKELLDKKMTGLESIRGLAWRKNDEIILNPPRPLIENLDELPLPDRQIKFHRNYSKQNLYAAIYLRLKKIKKFGQGKIKLAAFFSAWPFLDQIYFWLYNRRNRQSLPVASIITSRGCPYHCSFCAVHHVWGHRWRMRSAKNVLAEIDLLVKKFKVKYINILDDNFNASRQRTIEICRGIVERKYNLTLLASSGSYVPTLDEEVLTWLKKAGLNQIRMSIESGNPHILHDIIKKNINLDQVKAIVDSCKKLGIYTEGAFIFGIPGETIETMQESLDFAKRVGFDSVIKFIFQPFPNTELFDLCVKNGYLTTNYDPSKAYVTGFKSYVKTENFSPEDVKQIVNRR